MDRGSTSHKTCQSGRETVETIGKDSNDLIIELPFNCNYKIRFDGGLHYYETYETKDGKFMTVGALEPQFYQKLVDILTDAGISDIPEQHPADNELAKRRMAQIFATKSQLEWQAIFDQTDACVTPVTTLDDAPHHRHNSARASFLLNKRGQFEPAPAPRLSRTPAQPANNQPEPKIGQSSTDVLQELGYPPSEIQQLIDSEVVYQAALDAKL